MPGFPDMLPTAWAEYVENTNMLSPHSQNSYYDFLCGGGGGPEIVSKLKEVAGRADWVPRNNHIPMVCSFSCSVPSVPSPSNPICYACAVFAELSAAISTRPARHTLAHNSVLIPIQCRRSYAALKDVFQGFFHPYHLQKINRIVPFT